jgi:hypothetical protein
MWMVGPRPAIPSDVAQHQQWQRRRLRMRLDWMMILRTIPVVFLGKGAN